jgi:hypothetical protein
MPKQNKKAKLKAKPNAKPAPAKAPNPLDDFVKELERYEKGTPPVKPQACADCPGEDEVDDEH